MNNHSILKELEIIHAKVETVKESLSKRPPGPRLSRQLVLELEDIGVQIQRLSANITDE